MLIYLQIGKLDVGLNFQRAKMYRWEGQHLFRIWPNGRVWVVTRPKLQEIIMKHAHEELGHFGVCRIVCFKVNMGGKACNWKFNF